MKKNKNAPGKGEEKTVEPIRKLKDIKAISQLLENQPRNHFLFTLGINNGLRMGDLLRLKVKDFKNKKINDTIFIIESKTKKKNFLKINKSVYISLQKYLNSVALEDDDFIFKSRKTKTGKNIPISVPTATNLIKKWTDSINLQGRYGSHTLRKTWGYVQRVYFGVPYEIICKRYLHDSPKTTMLYLGIEDIEVEEILLNEIG